MTDIICPKCERTIALTNMIGFEENEMEILGIAYGIKCKKCDTIFVTPLRHSKQVADKKQQDLIKELFKGAKNVGK